jgi:hypothetical protein
MRMSRRRGRLPVLMVLFVITTLISGLSVAATQSAPAANPASSPNKVGGLDCNG